MRGFAFRPLGALDLDLAARLHREAFAPRGERPWTRQELGELLASPGVTGSVIQSDGQDIGFALWRIAADEAELLTLAVDGAHRRRGAGRVLLQTAIDGARAGGAHSLFLEVDIGNQPARALYQQLAFEIVGRRPSYYQRGEGISAEALVMRLKLTSGE